MTQLLNNPWFVGIAGGVLSGLFVAIITRALFSRRDKREYIQKLNQANSEVLYALRPGVSEGVIPQRQVVESLIASTARKYNVDSEDMYDANVLADELIKEVMDSSFISAVSKGTFCEKITTFKILPEQKRTERPELVREFEVMAKYRRQTVAMLSMMAALLSALMGFMAVFQVDKVKTDDKFLFVMMLPAVVTVIAAFLVRILKDLKAQTLKVRVLGTEIIFREKKDKSAEQGGGEERR